MFHQLRPPPIHTSCFAYLIKASHTEKPPFPPDPSSSSKQRYVWSLYSWPLIPPRPNQSLYKQCHLCQGEAVEASNHHANQVRSVLAAVVNVPSDFTSYYQSSPRGDSGVPYTSQAITPMYCLRVPVPATTGNIPQHSGSEM